MIHFYDAPLTSQELRQANEKLAGILKECLKLTEAVAESSLYSNLFPALVYVKNPKKCRMVVQELLLMIEDDFVHCLPALHRFALYHLLEHCRQMSATSSSEDVRPYSFVPQQLEDPEFYLEWCFIDLRFFHVAKAFEHYRANDGNYAPMRMNLDEYVDLMPEDIKNEYDIIKSERGG